MGSNENFNLVKVESFDEKLLGAAVRLMPQLIESAAPPSAQVIKEVVSCPGSTLFALENGSEEIVGFLLLGFYRTISGNRAWIEDVVVDSGYRGKGLSKKLVSHAVAYAKLLGADTVMLTSNPKREIANLLYQQMGFRLKNTNLYVLSLNE